MNFSISSLILEKISHPLFTQASFSTFQDLNFYNFKISKFFTNSFYLSKGKYSFKLIKSDFSNSLDTVVRTNSIDYSNQTYNSQQKLQDINIQILSCTFDRCSSENGGAIYAECSDFECYSCLFYNCKSNHNYGAIYALISSTSNIENCCFESCFATDRYNVIRTEGDNNDNAESIIQQTTIHHTKSKSDYIISIDSMGADISYVNSTENNIQQNKGGLAYFSLCYPINFQYCSVNKVTCTCFVYSYYQDNPKSLAVDHFDILNNTFYYYPLLVKREKPSQPYAAVIKFTRFLYNKIEKHDETEEEAKIRLTIAQSYFDCDPDLFFNYTRTDKPVNVVNVSYPLDPLTPIDSGICVHDITPSNDNLDEGSNSIKSNHKKIAIIVCSIVGVLIVVGLVIFFVFKYKRNSDAEIWFREETAQIANPLT